MIVETGAAIWSRARNMAAVADVLEERGVTLAWLKENVTFAPGTQELTAFRQAAQMMHLLDRAGRSEAIKEGLAAKRQKGGRHCANPGYGKKWVGRRGHERLVDDPEEQDVIAKIQEWWTKGYSAEAIFKHLRNQGVQTQAGRFWSRDRIRRVIKRGISAVTAPGLS